MTRLAVIGMGEQSRRSHLVCALHAQESGRDVVVGAIADFAAQLTNLDPLSRTVTRAAHHVVVEGENGAPFSLEQARHVVSQVRRAGVDAVLVATEPLVHDVYMQALQEAEVPYLVDKPFICPRDVSLDPAAADAGLVKWQLARRLWAESRLGSVNVSRRFDPTLRSVRAQLRDGQMSVNQVSYVYADGEVRDSDGCYLQEQHGFRYGYGALNHSAYHAFDTALWLCGFDSRLADVAEIRVQTFARTVDDYLVASGHDRRTDAATARTEYDCAVNVAVAFDDGATTLMSFSIVHDSPTNRVWQRATTNEQTLHLGRLSHEVVTATQGEKQCVLVHRQELPRQQGDPRRRGLNFASVTRNPLYADQVARPVYEVLADQPDERKRLETSGKWRAFDAFLNKADGRPYDAAIDLGGHLLTQLLVLLAARSLADAGNPQSWSGKELL